MTTSNTVIINEIPVDPTDNTKTAWGPTLASQYFFVIANGTAAAETFDAADISAATKTLMATYGRGITVNMGAGNDTVIGSAYGDTFNLGDGTNYADGGDNQGTLPGGARARDVLNVFAASQAAADALTVVALDAAATGADGEAYAAGYRIKVSNGAETDYLKNVEQVNVFVSAGSGYTFAKTVQLAVNVMEADATTNLSNNLDLAWVQGSQFNDSFNANTDISAATHTLMDQHKRGVWVDLGAGDDTVVGSAYGDDISVGAGTNYVDGGGNAGSPPWGGKAQDVLHVTVASQAAADAVQVIQLTAGMSGADAQAFSNGYTHKVAAGAETDYIKGIERVSVQVAASNGGSTWVRDIPLAVVVQEANLADTSANYYHLAWVNGTAGADTIDLSSGSTLLSSELQAALAARARGVWVDGGAGNDTITGTAFADNFRNGAGNAKIDGGANAGGIDVFEITVASSAEMSAVQVSASDDPAWQYMVTYGAGSTQKDYLKNIEAITINVAGTTTGKWIPLAVNVNEIAAGGDLANSMHYAWAQGTAQDDHFDAATDISAATRTLMDQHKRGVWVDLGAGNDTVAGSAYGDDISVGAGTNYVDGGGNAGSPPWGGKGQDVLHVTVADQAAAAAVQVTQLAAGMSGTDAQAFANGYTHKVVAGAETDYIKGIERVSIELAVNGGGSSWVRDVPLAVLVQEANLADPASANNYHLAWVNGTAGDDSIDLSSGSTLLSSEVQAAMAARGRGVWVDAGAGNDTITGTAYADNFRNGPGNSKIDGGANAGPAGAKGNDVFEIAVASTAELNAVQVSVSDDPAYQWMVTYGSGSTQKDYLKNIEAVSINVTGTSTGKWIALAQTVYEIASSGDLANSLDYAWVQGTALDETFNAATDISAATRTLMDQHQRGVWVDMGAGNDTVTGSGYGDDINAGAGTNYVDGGANAGSPPWGGKAIDVLRVTVADQAAADAVQVTQLAAGMSGADAQAFANGYTHKVAAGAETDYIKNIERVTVQVAAANGGTSWARDIALAVVVQEVNTSDPNAVKGSTLAWVTGTAGADTIDLSGDTPLLTSALKAAMATNKHGVYVDGGAGNDVITGTAYADYFRNGPGNSKIDGGSETAPDGQQGRDVFDITVGTAAEMAAVTVAPSDDPAYALMVTYGSGSTQKDYLKNIEGIWLHESATSTSKWIDLAPAPTPAPNTAPSFTGVPAGVAVSDFGTDYGALGGIALASGKLLTVSYGATPGADYMLYLTRANADGSVDTSFGGGTGRVLLPTSYGAVAAPLELAGGKLLVGVSTYGSTGDFRVLRMNADGSVDTSFGTNGSTTVSLGGGVDSLRKILVDGSGKIVMVGNTDSATGRDLAVVRLNADGSLDTSFNGSGKFTLSLGAGNAAANAVAVQADGKLVLAGFAPNGSVNEVAVVRLNADGTLDTSFGSGGKVLMPIGPGANLATTVEVLAGGKILLGGYAKTGADSATDWDPALIRLNADGSADASFGTGGVVKTHLSDFNDNLVAMKVQADGKIVVLSDSGFNASSMNGKVAVLRYNADGTLDTSFGNNGIAKIAIHGVSEQPNSLALVGDKIVVFGSSVNDANFDTSNVIVRLNANGTPDTTFGVSNPTSLGGTVKLDGIHPVALDANAAIYDYELAAGDNYAGATLTLARHGGANAEDVFRPVGEVTVDGTGNVIVGAIVIGTVTQAAGTLTVTFNANATQGLVNRAMHGIGYTNASGTPPSSVTIDWSFSDGNASHPLSATGSTTVQIGVQVYEKLHSVINADNAPDGTPLATLTYPGVVNGTAAADTFDSATGFSAAQLAVMDQYKHGAFYDMGPGDDTVTGTGYSDLFILGTGTNKVDGGAQAGTLNGGAGKDIVNVYATSKAAADAVTVVKLDASATGADKTAFDAGYDVKVVNGGEIDYLKNIEQVSILQWTDANGDGLRQSNEATFLRAVDLTAPPAAVNTAPTFTGVPAGVAVSDFGADYGALGGIALASGQLLTVSYGATLGADYMLYLTRANADGSVDTSFGGGTGRVLLPTSYGTVAAPLELAGGKLLVGVSTYGSTGDFRVLRMNADGSVDSSFGTNGSTTVSLGSGVDSLRKVLVDGSGKIVMVGNTDSATGRDLAVVRLNADGSLDTSFNGSGKFTLSLGAGNAAANAVAVQADGKLVLAGFAPNGSVNEVAVVRLNADGSLDTSFGSGGKVLMPIGPGANLATTVEVLAGGKILLGGYVKTGADSTTDWDPALVRLNADGSADASFGTGGVVKTHLSDFNDNLVAMKVQADGKIVVLSDSGFNASSMNGQVAVLRYNADGTLDTSFGSGGIARTTIHGISEQPNSVVLVGDKIVVFGSSVNDKNFDTSNFILRLNANGTPDTTFGVLNPSSLGGTVKSDGIHPVALDANVSIFDAELSKAGGYAGATLTLARHGGASADDIYFPVNELTADDNGNLMIGTIVVATATENAGTLTLTFTANATQGLVNRVMHGIGYANTSATPPSSVVMDWTFSDGNSGAQGSGGALSATGSTTVQIGMRVYEKVASLLNPATAPDGTPLATLLYPGVVNGTAGADSFDSATGFSAAQIAVMDQYKHGAYFDMGPGDDTVTGTGYSDLFVLGAGTNKVDGGAQAGTLDGTPGKDIVNVYATSQAAANAVTVVKLDATATGADKTAFDAGYDVKVTNGGEIDYLKNIEQVNIFTWTDSNDDGLRQNGETVYSRGQSLVLSVSEIPVSPTDATKDTGGHLLKDAWNLAWAYGWYGNDSFNVATDVSAATRALMDQYGRGVWASLGDGNDTFVGSAWGDTIELGRGTNYADGGANGGTNPNGVMARDELDIYVAPGTTVSSVKLTTGMSDATDAAAFSAGYTYKIMAGAEIDYVKNIEVAIVWNWTDANHNGQREGSETSWYGRIPFSLVVDEVTPGSTMDTLSQMAWAYGGPGDDSFSVSANVSAGTRALMAQYKAGAWIDMGDGNDVVVGSDYADNINLGKGVNKADGGANLPGNGSGIQARDVLEVIVASQAEADAVTSTALTADMTGADGAAYAEGYRFKIANGTSEIDYVKNIEDVRVMIWNDLNHNGQRDYGGDANEVTFGRMITLVPDSAPSFAGAPAGVALIRAGYDFTPTGLATMADGRMLTLSLMDMVANGDNYTTALARHNQDGSLDTSFGAGGMVLLPVTFGSVIAPPVVQADGKVLMAVSSTWAPGADFKVVRLNADGTVDSSFGSNGAAIVSLGAGSDTPTKLMVQADGKIVVAGNAGSASGGDMAAVRLTTSGQLDTTFNGTGTLVVAASAGIDRASAAVLQADGKLLLAGTAAGAADLDFALARVNTDGSLDTGFGSGGKVLLPVGTGDDRAYSVVVQGDGKILLAGDAFNGTDADLALARFNADGSVDTSFGSGGKVLLHQSAAVDRGQYVLVQGDGKIVTAGWSGGTANGGALTVTRLNADGTLDSGFGDHGVVALALQGIDNRAAGLALVNGKLVVLGVSSFDVNADASMALVRLNSDGSLDSTFGTPYANTLPNIVQADGLHPALLAFNGALYDAELAAQGNYAYASLNVMRQGGASADDVFVSSGEVSFANHVLSVSGTAIGTVDQSGGNLVIHFSGAATQGLVNRALHGIAYTNASAAPGTSVALQWKFADDQNVATYMISTVQIGVTVAEAVRAFVDPGADTTGAKLSTLPWLATVSGSLRGETFSADGALSAQVKALMAELGRGADIQTHGGGDTVSGTAYGDHFVTGAGVNYVDGGANGGTDPSGAAAVDVLEVFVASQAAADALQLVALNAQSSGADLAAFNAGYQFKVSAGSETDYLKNVEKVQVTIWNDLNGNHLQEAGELTAVKLVGVAAP